MTKPDVADLEAASMVCESIVLEGASRHVLHQQVLMSALECLHAQKTTAISGKKILGSALEETQVRSVLEQSFRALARMTNGEERIRLVEQANQVRPRTLV
jgi:serine/threonine-protein kinase PknG